MMKGNISFMTETGPHKLLVAGSNPTIATYFFTHSDTGMVNVTNPSPLFYSVVNINEINITLCSLMPVFIS